MPTKDLRPLGMIAARALVPAVCGALGVLFAMLAPIYYNAFCGIA